MNCKQVEKLLPLFTATDLDANQNVTVANHLANCAVCQVKAEEFSASQKWLQNLTMPEFSATQFSQIRAQVFAAMETTEAQKISPFCFGWQMGFGLAASVLLIVTGITMFMAHQSHLKIVEVAQDSFVLRTPPSPVTIARGTVPRAVATGSTSRTNRTNLAKRIGARAASSPIKPEAIVTANELQVDSAALADKLPALQSTTDQLQPEAPEMLRIEMQTADPNIKIIWLTPKDTIAANTKVDLR